jgi:uncharacterized membrane protein
MRGSGRAHRGTWVALRIVDADVLEEARERSANQVFSRHAETIPMPIGSAALRKLSADEESSLTATIPRPAARCFELFCDIRRVPEWLPIIRSAQVRERDARGRAREVAFLARLEGATIGYTLIYSYDERDLAVSWRTIGGSAIDVAGRVQFGPLGERAALISYRAVLALRPWLPPWADPVFAAHPESAVVSEFRDFVLRTEAPGAAPPVPLQMR